MHDGRVCYALTLGLYIPQCTRATRAEYENGARPFNVYNRSPSIYLAQQSHTRRLLCLSVCPGNEKKNRNLMFFWGGEIRDLKLGFISK